MYNEFQVIKTCFINIVNSFPGSSPIFISNIHIVSSIATGNKQVLEVFNPTLQNFFFNVELIGIVDVIMSGINISKIRSRLDYLNMMNI